MNILLEGSDCTFKSTIANKLSEKLNMQVIKGSSFELAKSTNQKLFLHHQEIASLNNVIIDRSIYSNRVYATLYNGYSILTEEQRLFIEDMIRNNTLIVYLTASEKTIVSRLKKRGDEHVTVDKVKDILNMYETVIFDAMSNGMNVIKYDTDKLTSDEIVNRIIQIVEVTRD